MTDDVNRPLPPEQQAIRDRGFHPSGTFVEFPEKELTQIWGEVLSVGGVGIHDNFFELGGHSLAAMRVVARVLQTVQLDLALQALFDAPTVAAMAQAIAERQGQRIKQEDLERLLAEVEAMTEAEGSEPDCWQGLVFALSRRATVWTDAPAAGDPGKSAAGDGSGPLARSVSSSKKIPTEVLVDGTHGVPVSDKNGRNLPTATR